MKNHTCPVCHKSYAAKAALRQHREATGHTQAGTNASTTRKRSQPKPLDKVHGGFTEREAMQHAMGVGSHTNILHDRILASAPVGTTEDGAKYFMAHCHPMDEVDLGPVRQPDMVTANSIAAELRAADQIGKPDDMTSGTWDCMVASVPFPDIAFVFRKKATTESNWSNWVAVPFASVPFGYLDIKTNKAPVGHQGTLWQMAKDIRVISKGLTIDLQASALTDGGTVYCAQYPNVPNWKESYGSIAAVGDWLESSPIFSLRMPYDYNDIVSMDNGFTEWQARKGTYLPIGNVSPANQYLPNMAGRLQYKNTSDATTYMDISGGVVELRDEQTSIDRQIVKLKHDNKHLVLPFGADNTQIGVSLFVGLASEATLAARVRTRVEATTSYNSPWTPFLGPCPLYDQRAMEQATMVKARLQHAYPAEYNSLGKILHSIGDALKSVLPFVSGVAGTLSKTGIPIVSQVAGPVSMISNALQRLFSG